MRLEKKWAICLYFQVLEIINRILNKEWVRIRVIIATRTQHC